MLKIKVATANRKNYGNVRDPKGIKYIVIHYTANDGDSDESNGRYFQDHIVEASAHYFVDDDSITQSVADNYVAWSVGGKKYPSCATTGGGEWHGKCTNNNSISVELCDSIRNGKYDFTPGTLENAVGLVQVLMKKYNVPIENVIRHFDVVGKICPRPFVEDEKAWEDFKERLVDEEMVSREKIIVNGKACEVDMIRKDGTTYVKTRDIAEVLGLKVGSKGKVPAIETKRI
ncbi:N-acetylmuramoyl-L-alanine amidase [Anaerotignum sp.]|uniref:peptidoglycan recognition protein family protein n=1 Tax=Anaerotignum sp. TaxID=2039241 RepID=UPI00331AAFFE